jgi:rod shape-determining protein MreC
MSDEKVQPGERILTSGGDRIFPKGMPVGTVAAVGPGPDLFLNIRVKPSANIARLEEVLVITKMEERAPEAVADNDGARRAFDILAQRLPTVAPPPPDKDKDKAGESPKPAGTNAAADGGKVAPELKKPQGTAFVSSTAKPKTGDVATAAARKTVSDAAPDKQKAVKPAQTTAKPPAASTGTAETAKDAQPQ